MRSIYNSLPSQVFEYANNVISGLIVAGEAIRLACQRYINWFDREDLYFDYAKVNKVVLFIQSLKHFETPFDGLNFILQDWQWWCIANIFGWINVETGLRLITDVYLLISRKCGKSSISAAISLAYMWLEGNGNEIYCIANTKDLAKICYKYCNGYARSIDPNLRYMKRYRDEIKNKVTNSTLKALAAEPDTLDGLNCSCFIWDEVCAAKDYKCYNILKSSLGMRKNALSISISSANFFLDGYPGYDMYKLGLEILRGVKNDDSWFYAMYMLDEDDDWRDEKVWKKAVPSLDITVTSKYLRGRVLQAVNEVSLEPDVRTKQFNQFVSNRLSWIPSKYIDDAMTKFVNLNELKGEICYCGIDLSSVQDLTAISILFPPNEYREYYPDKFIFKTLCYVPKEAVRYSSNLSIYDIFIHNNYLRLTPTNAIDYDFVLKDLLEISLNLQLIKCGYDKWNSLQFTKNASDYLTMEEFGLSLGSFNMPTKEFERLMLLGKVIIDKNMAVRWAFNNVEIKHDYMDNVKPIKFNDDLNNKIDPIIAMLEALGVFLKDNNWYFGEIETNLSE